MMNLPLYVQYNDQVLTGSRFASPWLIVSFIVVAASVLVFFFPKEKVLSRIRAQQTADRVARDYVSNLVVMYPNNKLLKLIHADQNIKLGEIANAVKEILPLVADQPKNEVDWKALWLYYKIIRTETYALPDIAPMRFSGLAKMQTMLDKLSQHFGTVPELMILAVDAISLNKPQTALALYYRIINLNPEGLPEQYAQAAKFALSQGDYRLSARLYFIAKNKALMLNAKRAYLISGLKSLQSGNLLDEALTAAESYVGDLSRDRETLIFLTRLALAANKPILAEKYINKAITNPSGSVENTFVPYVEELYLLAFNTFLANQNIKEAYAVAKLAVKARPNNFIWRQRLAQVATWNNEPRVALEQWLYIATHQENPRSPEESVMRANATERGIILARMLNDYFVLSELFRLKIKYHQGEEASWYGYVGAEESLGNPQKAINELLAVIKTDTKLFYFEKLAALYRATGDIKAETEFLDLIENKFGLTLKIALRQAEILYSDGKIAEAQQKLISAKSLAKVADFDFWRTLGELSWIVQDFNSAKISYEKLKQSGKIDQYSLINLIQLAEVSNKKDAFELALTGWYQYKMDYFLLKIFEFAPQLNEWSKLAAVIGTISEDTKTRIAKNLLYYAVEAQLFAKYNQQQQAIMVYEKALQILPDSIDLKVDYLWFLIDHEYTDVLRKKLLAWENIVFSNVNFSNAYAAGCVFLNEPEAALNIYRHQFAKQQHDPQWLINLASTLEQLGRPIETTLIRELAWYRLMRLPLSQEKYSLAALNDFMRVAMYRQSGDISAWGLFQLSQDPKDQDSNANLLTWALILSDFELANYVYNFYGVNQNIPLWIPQTLALNNNDLYLMNTLLQGKVAELPYRDRVEAATRTGNEGLAETLAYRGLAEHPLDAEMYKLFTDTMLLASDNFDIDSAYLKNGNIGGLQEKIEYTSFLTPRISISPWINTWQTSSGDSSQILNATYLDRAFGIKARRRHKHGTTMVNLGERHGLADFIMLELADSYSLTSKLNLVMSLGYQQTAYETSPLLIAGMKNEVKVGAEYQLTVRDSFSSNFYYKNFNSQDGVFLGRGQVLDVYYNHKFEFGYPDWNMSLFSSVNRYQDSGSVSTMAQNIIPATQSPAASFFIPTDFIRCGAGFGFGQAYRDVYTHAWRPFAEASIFEDTGIGIGNYFDVGLAGSVFGRDHLAFYYERSIGFTVGNQIDYIYGMRYRINF